MSGKQWQGQNIVRNKPYMHVHGHLIYVKSYCKESSEGKYAYQIKPSIQLRVIQSTIKEDKNTIENWRKVLQLHFTNKGYLKY